MALGDHVLLLCNIPSGHGMLVCTTNLDGLMHSAAKLVVEGLPHEFGELCRIFKYNLRHGVGIGAKLSFHFNLEETKSLLRRVQSLTVCFTKRLTQSHVDVIKTKSDEIHGFDPTVVRLLADENENIWVHASLKIAEGVLKAVIDEASG
jgi:hypothetical protein